MNFVLQYKANMQSNKLHSVSTNYLRVDATPSFQKTEHRE
jgi:hypothetical protein